MAVKGLPADTQLIAQLTNLGAGLAHSRLGETELGGGHLEWTTTLATAGAGRCKPCPGALDDEVVFELGERGENAENQTPIGRRGVQVGALTGQHFQPHTAPGQIVNEVDEMPQVATEPVELPGHQCVTGPQRLETRFQPGPIVPLAGCVILVKLAGGNAGAKQSVALEVQHLAAVRLAHAHVADQHRAFAPYTTG